MKTAIFICGPTAVGKTKVAIEIAQWLKAEIISFDSRQFYQELKIGAAPPDTQELAAVKHHFIAHLPVEKTLSAGAFEAQALKLMWQIFQEKENIVLVGGSGLYMKALTEGFDALPQVSPETREEINALYREKGLSFLQEQVQKKDPEFYAQVDSSNPQRLIRALEIIESSGKKFSSFRQKRKAKREFSCVKIGLNMPREQLYDRINLRVDMMMNAGLLEEARKLYSQRELNALQTVGYRELFSHFDGDYDLETAVAEIKKNSRRYAKRQLTWFRRDEEIKWFEPAQTKEIIAYLRATLHD